MVQRGTRNVDSTVETIEFLQIHYIHSKFTSCEVFDSYTVSFLSMTVVKWSADSKEVIFGILTVEALGTGGVGSAAELRVFTRRKINFGTVGISGFLSRSVNSNTSNSACSSGTLVSGVKGEEIGSVYERINCEISRDKHKNKIEQYLKSVTTFCRRVRLQSLIIG